jgi:hypothetical protein
VRWSVDDVPRGRPAAWALAQAAEELYDVEDVTVIEERARGLERERRERHDERHDEYDDPDAGGEG